MKEKAPEPNGSGASLYIFDILATLYLCKYTNIENLETFYRKGIDFLESLWYNIIKEREGKP